MPDRYRYVGPYEEETLLLEDGPVTVKKNGLLPEDVPAKVRDEIAQRADWNKVESSASTSTKKED